jgi:hypothetical protein
MCTLKVRQLSEVELSEKLDYIRTGRSGILSIYAHCTDYS